MDLVLERDAPPPSDMPNRVTLVRFEVGGPNGPHEHWQLKGGDHTWTMRMTEPHLSDLLAWLNRHGYAPVAGTNPAQFQQR